MKTKDKIIEDEIERLRTEWLNNDCTHQPNDDAVCLKCINELIKKSIFRGRQEALAEKGLIKIEDVIKMIDERIIYLERQRRRIPKNIDCKSNRREVAIRQVQGRILELDYIKQQLKKQGEKQ